MRHLLLLSLFLVLWPSVFSQSSTSGIDFRISGVGHGSTPAFIARRLGKPLRSRDRREPGNDSCFSEPHTFRTLNYAGLEISLIGDGKGRKLRTYEIQVNSGKWLISGVRIGSNRAGVRGVLGKPREEFERDGTTTWYYENRGQSAEVSFDFVNEKLMRILMSESLC